MLEVKSKSVSKKNSTVSAAVLKKWSVTPEKRYQMIAEAAYFRAEKRGFVMGDAAQDWLEAEAEICGILQEPKENGEGSRASAKQSFQQKLEAQLKEWDAKLDDLKAKALETKDEIRAEYEKQFDVLAGKRAAAQAKLQELRLRTDDAWEDLKGGTEKAWDEMRKALDRIASRFK